MTANRELIQQRARNLLANILKMDASGIEENASLRSNGLDSIGMIELIAELETEFNIRIADREVRPEVFENLSSLTDFIAKKI